ncbi:arylsulfatase precursor [Moesziomyces aphidis]|uniref:Arylsulfatase n=1 Tax=Moesziomyces aphidis TaxID=84754 RepID=W3VLM7_MOEAP|nr:arylsulfatase precursor [Moesziomyces aphidis]
MSTLRLLLACLVLFVGARSASAATRRSSEKPNFVYIIVDDQDFSTASPQIMPRLTERIASQGTNFTHFYTPMSICCPSRVGFLRGQHGHSHNVTNVALPYGGWTRFVAQGYRRDYLPTWLQEAGYNTYYTGKLMNGNTVKNWQASPVLGFNRSAILNDPFTYVYNTASFAIDGKQLVQYEGQYSTDVVRDFGLQYLEEAASSGQPFFVGIAPIGPHAETTFINGSAIFSNPVPAKRHKDLFATEVAPRKSSFNADDPSGAGFVRDLPHLNSSVVDYLDEWYRDRLRSLQAVDELVGAVMDKAEQLGILDNTYFIYSSDNGYSVGEHRRQPGKTTGYEEDIRQDAVYSNIDLTASIVEKAQAQPSYDLDGRVMAWAEDKTSFRKSGTATHHLSEFWVSQTDGEGRYSGEGPVILKYRTLRVKDGEHDLSYTVWCTGERELYNMAKDSDQMNNLVGQLAFYSSLNSTSSDAERIASRMDALLLNLKTCHGSLCRRLWYNLFPEGQVQDLSSALQTRWDAYFDSMPRVHFDTCRDGYFPTEELPAWRNELVYVDPALLA